MEKINPLVLLARATDTKGYPDDKDPSHWKTIHHAPVHIDKDGHVDGGAGGKFHGAPWSSTKHPHKATPESYGGTSKPEPATPTKTVEDLKAAWKKVAKERMEIHRAKTEKSRAAHTAKLDAAYKEYTDMRASMDPAEAAKFKPTSGGTAGSPKAAKVAAPADPVASLAAATTPAEPIDVITKARNFELYGKSALEYYAAYKASGDESDLTEAQQALKDATAYMELLPKDSKAFADARKKLVDVCKAKGLTGAKLRDVFKEIKMATHTPPPTPPVTPPSTSPLATLAEATSGAGASSGGGPDREELKKIRSARPTLKKFTDHHDKKVKELYEKSRIRDEDIPEFEGYMKKLFDESDYGMNITDTSLLKVLDSGKFKNQYETKTGGGAVGSYALTRRAGIWGGLLGLGGREGMEKTPEGEREKYGSLIPKDVSYSGPSWYGSLVVRFKKENLKGRVTYTVGDSLGFDVSDVKTAGDADRPSIAGFKQRMDKAYKAFVDFRAGRIKKPEDLAGDYVELQYNGDLLPSDIASVTFPGGIYGSEQRELVKRLTAIGVLCQDDRGRKLSV